MRGKRTNFYGPWSILGLGNKHDKRTFALEQDIDNLNGDTRSIPYEFMRYLDSRAPEVEYSQNKRSLPWVILNKSASGAWNRNYDTDKK